MAVALVTGANGFIGSHLVRALAARGYAVRGLVRGYVGRLPTTIVRPSSVYGEGERGISQVFAPVWCRLQPRLGWRRRHVVMVSVGDLVEGIIAAALSAASVGETYFLNHPEVLTPAQVTSSIAAAMGKRAGLPLPAPTVLLRLIAPLAEVAYHFTCNRPPITRDKAREVSQRNWVADPGKAQRDFGWTARHHLVAGLTPTVQAWAAAERGLIAATGESPRGAWLKSVVIATLLGAGIELSSKLGGFYAFDPPAGVFVIVFGAFGLALGSLAHVLRRACPLVKLLVGWVVAGGVEAANVAGLVPGLSWTFAPGWPLGIDSDLWRTVVLGAAGGVFILVVEAIVTALYRRRRRLG